MKNKSFTLIELLLVISIIGLLTLVIVSGLRSITDRARIARTLQYQASLHRSIGNHLVGWWNFNEGTPGTCQGGADVCDISGYNNHGTLIGTVLPQWVEGVPATEGQSLSFDGFSSGVLLEETPLVFAGNLTISMWVFFNDDSRGILFGSYNTANSVNIEKHTSHRLRINWNIGERDVFTLNNTTSENTWQFVSFVRDKNDNEFKFYLDGKEVHSVSGTGTDVTPVGPFRIGRDYRIGTTVTNGRIDDVRIYNTALTAEEIERIYTETKHKYIAEY